MNKIKEAWGTLSVLGKVLVTLFIIVLLILIWSNWNTYKEKNDGLNRVRVEGEVLKDKLKEQKKLTIKYRKTADSLETLWKRFSIKRLEDSVNRRYNKKRLEIINFPLDSIVEGLAREVSKTKKAIYPKKVIHKDATLITITSEQGKDLLLANVDLKQSNELNDSLRIQISRDSVLIIALKKLSINYVEGLKVDSILISNNRLIIQQQSVSIKKLKRNLRRARNGNKILGGGLLAGVVIVLAAILIK